MQFHMPDDIRSFASEAFQKAFAAEVAAPAEDAKTLAAPVEKVFSSETPPEKTTEKSVEKSPEQDELPETLPNEGRGDAWKNFRTQYHKVRDEAKATKAELDAKKAELADFDGTKKERDELKAQIEALREEEKKWKEVTTLGSFESRPDIQAEFVKPRTDALARLKEYAGYGEIDPGALTAAISKSGKARFDALEDLLSGAPSTVRGKIERTIDEIDNLDGRLAGERANAAESIKQRDARIASERQQRQDQFTKHAIETFDATAAELKDLGLPPEEIGKARDFFLKNSDLKEASKLLLKGFAADLSVKERAGLKKELDEAKAELARLRKAEPGLDSGGGVDRKDNKSVDFTEGAKAIFRQTKAA